MQENFYQNGYIELDYLNNDIINIFNKRLRDLISLEDQWKKKYKFTKDLKFEYLKTENIFFDYLFKNDFHNKINQITTKKLILTNIQVRTCFKGLSYMTWHRDTYRSKEKIIGPFMPCFKLMVYPDLYNIKSKEISLIAKSHNRLDFTYYHKYLSSFNPRKKNIFNNNNHCTLIDTTILHKAVSSLKDIARPRVIYNFSTIETIEKFYNSELNKFYIDKYNKYLN
jgi:hypothetical protein